MIEVTCGACGTTHRFAESDVPPGGRTTTCTACKAKLVVPGSPPAGGNTGDVIDLAELPAPPATPATPARTGPAAGPPGITDLPTPKRSATPATPARTEPAAGPPSIADLPAPKRAAGPPLADLPTPKRAGDGAGGGAG